MMTRLFAAQFIFPIERTIAWVDSAYAPSHATVTARAPQGLGIGARFGNGNIAGQSYDDRAHPLR